MNLGAEFFLALLQIIWVNIILSGDNAVVIALACRSLPPRQQRIGVMLGAGAAVVLRIIFSVIIVYLMSIPLLKFVGGVLLLWIGYKLMIPEEGDGDDIESASNLMRAVMIVLWADLIMSLDNVIAVAAAAKGDIVLLSLGLAISVPLVVYGATLMIRLLQRFPVLVTVGAALIGYIAGDVIATDPYWINWVETHAAWLEYAGPLLGALLVVGIGRFAAGRMAAKSAAQSVDLANR